MLKQIFDLVGVQEQGNISSASECLMQPFDQASLGFHGLPVWRQLEEICTPPDIRRYASRMILMLDMHHGSPRDELRPLQVLESHFKQGCLVLELSRLQELPAILPIYSLHIPLEIACHPGSFAQACHPIGDPGFRDIVLVA